MGKAYANRKKLENRPESDFYQTMRPLTWELMKLGLFDFNKTVLEPASGDLAIFNILSDTFCSGNVLHGDIKNGFNFLTWDKYKNNEYGHLDYIITNPPFSLFDKFVMKAKEVAKEKIAFIGKTNFFGAYQRNKNGIWDNLSDVYIFNRQVDYRFFREDNKMVAGNLITGWFIWDMSWKEKWWRTHIIDVQKYMLSNKDIK